VRLLPASASPADQPPVTLRGLRSRRGLISRGRYGFLLAVVALAVWWINYQGEPHDYKADQARILVGAALAGAIGFLGWFSYRLRLMLILVSGLFWAFIGAVTLFYGVSPYPYMLRFLGRDYPATMGGVVFVAVGLRRSRRGAKQI
jgi:hypothetical protein